MDEKCSKCGAEIPADSKFCLQCGGKVNRETKTATDEQIHILIKSIFSKNFIIAGFLLGLFLAWIGTLVLTFSGDLTGFKAAITLNYLGFFLMGIFLIGGGIVNDLFDKYVRLGMIFGGSFLLASSLVISMSSLLSAIRTF